MSYSRCSSSVARWGNSNVAVPLRRQQRGDARREVVDVRHLREHVVPEHEVGATSLAGEPPPELRAEELDNVGTPRAIAASATLRAGSMPSTGCPSAENAEEIAVVRRQLDDEALRASSRRSVIIVDVPARVLDPGVGVRGEIGVLGEDLVRRHELGNLREPAAPRRRARGAGRRPRPARAARLVRTVWQGGDFRGRPSSAQAARHNDGTQTNPGQTGPRVAKRSRSLQPPLALCL